MSASVSDVTTTSETTSESVSVATSFSTVTETSSTATISSEATITSSTVISSVFVSPSTTFVAPSTESSVVAVTSTVTFSAASTGGTEVPSVVVITSTAPQPSTSQATASSSSSSASSSPSALSASGSSSSTSGGLGTGGKIAIAVVIPIVVLAAGFFFGLWFWKKRKARKNAEELRKNEMAEYGFNPNNDQTLAPVVAAGVYHENGSDAAEDNSGYRGWGATSSNRKASTTLGSNSRPQGLALSDGGSQPGGYQGSPNGTGQGSEHYSPDPLLRSHPEGGDGISELGGAGAGAGAAAGGLARQRSSNADIKRGISNASSAYSSGLAHSEASSDTPAMPGPYYPEEVPYNIYNDAAPIHGPYGDGSYGGSGAQPIIRDVQARRNTRIERAPTFPQTQGGIAQNF